MKKDFIYWLKWIAVFPGAIIAGLLATFPLHWVLYATLANGETISGVNINPIEYFLYPFVIAIIYILAGYKIAPDNKFRAASVLFGVYVLFWIVASIIALSSNSIFGLNLQFSGRTILSLIGAIIGLFIVKKIHNKTLANQ